MNHVNFSQHPFPSLAIAASYYSLCYGAFYILVTIIISLIVSTEIYLQRKHERKRKQTQNLKLHKKSIEMSIPKQAPSLKQPNASNKYTTTQSIDIISPSPHTLTPQPNQNISEILELATPSPPMTSNLSTQSNNAGPFVIVTEYNVNDTKQSKPSC